MIQTSDVVEAVLANPKTGWFVLAATGAEQAWIDWGNPVISVLTKIGSLVLILVLIRKHTKNDDDKKK